MSYNYQHFWKLRGASAFWLTTHFGYRPGALLALVAARMGLSPNLVSIAAFGVSIFALLPLIFTDWPAWQQGLWLGGFSLVGYWLDCADGLLARGTGQTSTFGAVFDKTNDMAVMILSTSVIGIAALGQQSWWIPDTWKLLIFPLTLLPRATLSVLNWLKDMELHQANRLRPYEPSRTLFGKGKRFIGNLMDDVALRTGTAVAWIIGAYWEFALAISTALLILLIGYLLTTKRDLDAADRAKAGR